MPHRRIVKPPPTPLAKRLHKIMEDTGWSGAELARAAKCSPKNVYAWLSGQNERMTDANWAINIQAKSKFNANWIMSGKPPIYVISLTPADEKNLQALRDAAEDRKAALRLILPDLDI